MQSSGMQPPGAQPPGTRSSDFGQMVRRSRDRVAPEAVGVPTGHRRRAAGLRREELAALAGISADYLTRLEQGRATAPSVQVVEALAQALRLPDAEREVLYRLAGHAMPGPDLVPSRLTPSVQRLLDRLSQTPVVVYDATWTLLTANAPYDALMGETSAWHGIRRNAIWRNLHGLNRTVHTPQEQAEHEARLIADLRLTATRYPADQSLRKLVRDLTEDSARFAELWDAEAPGLPTTGLGKRKTVEHPTVGRITLDCDTLVVAGDDLRIMAYTAEPGSADAERLALAIVLGTQSLVE